MKSRSLLYASVAAITLLSSGCSVVRSLGFHRAVPSDKTQQAMAPQAPAAPAAAAAPSDVSAGRVQLDSANYGLAIESFRKALARSEDSPAALNGLGVAYARIGRHDLAERYFRQASAADPASQRYADNLVVVLRAIEEKQRMAQLEASFDNALRPAAVTLASQSPAARPVTGRLTKVSPHNFVISTAGRSPGLAPVAVARATSSQAAPGFKPLVRIEFGKRQVAPAETAQK